MIKVTDKNDTRPLIVFGEDWGVHPSSTQYLIKILNRQRVIVWVNSIGLRKPRFCLRDLLRIVNKVKVYIFNKAETKSKTEKNGFNQKSLVKDFVVINPLIIPCADSWLTITLNKLILKKQLKLAMNKLKIKNPIIWSSLPTSVDYLKLLGDFPCVYYCGDDFSGLAGVDHKLVTKKEKALVTRSEYIFTASEKLNKKFPSSKTITIPHGVNYQLFSQQSTSLPNDQPNEKPIAGFYGSISSWLDQPLIVQTAKKLPNWNFVFIGNIECDVSEMRACSNIFFLGIKEHEQLPQYIQHWNVAILPFKDNKQIQMCNPLKLREYLASGTPIVATNFNALDDYRTHIQVTDQHKSFHQAIVFANANIVDAVNFDKIEKFNDLLPLINCKANRMQSVIHESWQSRADKVQYYLSSC